MCRTTVAGLLCIAAIVATVLAASGGSRPTATQKNVTDPPRARALHSPLTHRTTAGTSDGPAAGAWQVPLRKEVSWRIAGL